MAIADEALRYQLALGADGRRKELGAYYTPEWMVDALLDHALDPLLDRPEPIHICDPACGAGAFLLATAERLRLRGRRTDNLSGVDLDPAALDLTRRAFQDRGLPLPNLRLANALVEPPANVDVMVGNPPFRNAIERSTPSATRKYFPVLGGTADLAFEFLAMAHQSVSPEGRIGFVLPRTVLNAPAAQGLRKLLHPRWIHIPERANHFSGANVFVALVVTGPPGTCLTDLGENSGSDGNWWRLAQGIAPQGAGPRLGDLFEVSASMTTGDAYLVRDWVEEDGEGLRLITTGLIDPGSHQWGNRTCRFLGRRYERPTVNPTVLEGALAARAQRTLRPKVVVAGLSRRLEAYLDAAGTTLGSVSTYSIYHPTDDLGELSRLLNLLLSDSATHRFKAELGANAMGGGSITVTKAFLQDLALGQL